jgi:isopentenyl-diphosphate Delta-isomerase
MSQDELVDVINENGEVLEVVTKKEAHERGLLHKTVVPMLVDSKGRWLLTKQSSTRQDAGQYVSPIGGHVKSGESEEEALRREAGEEVGLTGDFKFEYVGRKIFNRNILGRQENHFYVVYKIFSDHTPVLNYESESCKYFTEEELKKEQKENPQIFGAAFYFLIDNFFPELKP